MRGRGSCGTGEGGHLSVMLEDLICLGLIEDEEIILDEAALSLALLDHPEVDDEPFWDVLSDISDSLAGFEAATNPTVQAGHLARVLCGDFHFTGDREAYENPVNADLMQVIERRRGLPVSLSILYVAAARRLGWMASALDVPGHVLVMIGRQAEPVIIDPFNDGKVVEPDRLAMLVGSALMAPAMTVRHLTAMPNRAVLIRLLLNQTIRAKSAGQMGRAEQLYRRITVIAPSYGQAWWECAQCELARGETDAARISLMSMLEVTRDAELRKKITDIFSSLSGGIV